MDTVPTPAGTDSRPDPVDRAEAALRHFGAITREQAERLLTAWKHRDSLTTAETAAVLDRFAESHPSWCSKRHTDPRVCEERDQHESVALAITATGDELVGVRLRLVALITDSAPLTFAMITFSEDGAERDYPLSIGQLRVLARSARVFHEEARVA